MHSAEGSYSNQQSDRLSRAASRTVQFTPTEARAAYLDFHQQEFSLVVSFVMTCGAVREDAEDAAQDAFIDLWRLTEQPGGWECIESPRGWIRKVALRKYYRIQKEGSLKNDVVVRELTASLPRHKISDHAELTVMTEFVRSALRDLDLDTRVVMAFTLDDFQPIDIARILNVSDQKIRDQIKKGRRILRVALAPLRESDGGYQE
jgi:RNA polymerase sigma factor (sigma-70 family)